MISIIKRRDGFARINAESTDVLQVNYTDVNKRIDYILGNSTVWDTNNPDEDTTIQSPTTTIKFATDKEIEEAIQAIIDSYEGKKVKIKISASPWWKNATISDINDDIVEYNKMGINNFEICFHIENENNKMVIKEDIEALLDLSKRANINAIKIHCVYEVFKSITNSRNEYRNIVLDLANKFKGLNIKYFIILNELDQIHHNNTEENYNYINGLFEEIRKLGYIPGTSLKGLESYEATKANFSDLIDISECIFINFYPWISDKGINTKKEDSIKAWDSYVDKFEKIKQEYPDKPIIISESGIRHYWEYLSYPWGYNKDNVYTDGKGEVAKIFFYGLFENKKLNNLLDELWIWYPEQMKYKEFYDFMKRYI